MARVRINSGKYNRNVSLFHFPTAAGDAVAGVPLSPATGWVFLQPQGSDYNIRSTTFFVEMRYRPDVTLDTRFSFTDPATNAVRQFFVRSVVNVDEAYAVMRLTAEEVS